MVIKGEKGAVLVRKRGDEPTFGTEKKHGAVGLLGELVVHHIKPPERAPLVVHRNGP